MTSTRFKVCVLITQEDKFLLIKEISEKENIYKWNVIKGKVEEETIAKAALREAEEEVNVRVDLTNSLGVHVKYYGDDKFTIYFLYLAKLISGTPQLTDKEIQLKRSEDIIETRWFTREELENMDQSDFVSDVSYILIRKILENKIYPLDIITTHNF